MQKVEFKSLYFNLVYVFFFSSKTRIYINKTYTKGSLKRFISSLSDYYRTFFSVLSRGNEKLFKSQRFAHRESVNYASSQAQSRIQISPTGKTSRQHIDVLL